MNRRKKYGNPYPRKRLLRRGDIKKITEATGFSYINVCQQMAGDRTMHPTVRAMADKLADQSEALISSIKNNNQ